MDLTPYLESLRGDLNAAEITPRLHGPVVDVRLRGREADLVVTEPAAAPPEAAPVHPTDGRDQARLTLRMPEALKAHVEQVAAAEGVSVNAWLVRAVANAAGPRPPEGRPGKRITGFAQA